MRTTPPRQSASLQSTNGVRLVVLAAVAVCVAATSAGCAETSDERAGLVDIPTRTAAAATTSDAPTPAAGTSTAPAVDNFTVLPTFTCLKDEPARSVVTVGWSAPSATAVTLSLDGQPLQTGIRTEVPFQVPAGGPTGIGAAVVFDCRSSDVHTIEVVWTDGTSSQSRTVTITKESKNG